MKPTRRSDNAMARKRPHTDNAECQAPGVGTISCTDPPADPRPRKLEAW